MGKSATIKWLRERNESFEKELDRLNNKVEKLERKIEKLKSHKNKRKKKHKDGAIYFRPGTSAREYIR